MLLLVTVWYAYRPLAAPIPFSSFLASIKSAEADQYVGQIGYQVKNEPAFEEMRQFLLKRYSGDHVNRTILIDGQVFDCILFAEQPALREQQDVPLASPPPSSPDGSDATSARATSPLGPQTCDAGTIPVRRITLAELARFQTLDQYFQK
jgi:hypothetical protein